jgi:iron complex transport system ATP-binding protein
VIRAQGLRHSYDKGSTLVLDEVSVELTRGCVTGLIGPNGAGKSTLLSAMARLLVPDSGQVLLDDLDVLQAPAKEVARRLAVLRQDARVTARLTVVDLVRFGRFPYSQGRLTARDHEVVQECLDQVGMDRFRDRYLDELSGGQRQRAFVAMVLAQETEFVLLDEPLNNLDMEHAGATMQLLRRAADEMGRTVIVVLHDVNVAAAFCDVIVGMRDGRVVAHGPAHDVVSAEGLRRVFGLDIPVHLIDGRPVALHWAMGARRPLPA